MSDEKESLETTLYNMSFSSFYFSFRHPLDLGHHIHGQTFFLTHFTTITASQDTLSLDSSLDLPSNTPIVQPLRIRRTRVSVGRRRCGYVNCSFHRGLVGSLVEQLAWAESSTYSVLTARSRLDTRLCVARDRFHELARGHIEGRSKKKVVLFYLVMGDSMRGVTAIRSDAMLRAEIAPWRWVTGMQ